jgi:hypothetical protein
MIYRGPGFLDRRATHRKNEKERQLPWRERGTRGWEGAKSCEKAWSSINHSILSAYGISKRGMRRVKTKTIHLFSGGRDQGKRLVVRERIPNYQYLALFVYQLMK